MFIIPMALAAFVGADVATDGAQSKKIEDFFKNEPKKECMVVHVVETTFPEWTEYDKVICDGKEVARIQK